MTRDEALDELRLAYNKLLVVRSSSVLDKSQQVMLDIAIGRTRTVGIQLKNGPRQPSSVQPTAA